MKRDRLTTTIAGAQVPSVIMFCITLISRRGDGETEKILRAIAAYFGFDVIKRQG